MKKLMAMFLAATMAASLAACGGSSTATTTAAPAAPAETQAAAAGETEAAAPAAAEAAAPATAGGIFHSVEAFPYASLDPHKDYQSWHTQFYGISETLFKITDDLSIEPWLAEGMEVADNVATITLKDGVCFSNGNPLTADMVKRNLERLGTECSRYAYMLDWTMEATDDKTLVITTEKAYPALINDLATAETGIVDLDSTTDFDKDPICTGPFKVKEFIPEGDVTVERNENYWGGPVNLDGAVFYKMGDEESKLLAMQNGEIDGYVDIAASSAEIYGTDPDSYDLYTVPTQRRVYAYLNSAQLPDSVREAIVLAVDRDQVAAYMNGLISPATGAYSPDTPYGKVQQPMWDVAKAKEVLEADGYTMGASGIYEKDGKPLNIILSCYAKRSVDTVALLMQEQLKAAGIGIELKVEEDPDGTYMSTHDYQMAMYVSITDKTGDPMNFLEGTVKSGVYMEVAGFGNAETDAMIEEVRYETDPAKRAEITNEIMQKLYDSHDMLFIGTYNKNSVLKAGAKGLGVTNPMGFYGIDANTSL